MDEKDKGQDLYADSAYIGQEEVLEKYNVINKIHEKGYKNKPLTEIKKQIIKKNRKHEQDWNMYLDLWKTAWVRCFIER